MMWGWRPYVPVWERRQRAERQMNKLRKKGVPIQPIEIGGRTIAGTFWGKAWCEHLEKFSDFENRLPRGRTYVRNGSVCHLETQKGKISAKVIGSSLYNVNISIQALADAKWKRIRKVCAGQVGSMLELLQGKLSSQVMSIVTDRKNGLFPLPKEIAFDCSCPDWADMCKHVAAVLYGVGARLDKSPELLFQLRGVDHNELVNASVAKAVIVSGPAGKGRILRMDSLAGVFGIELDDGKPPEGAQPSKAPARAARAGAPACAKSSTGERKANGGKAKTKRKAPPGPSLQPRGRPRKS